MSQDRRRQRGQLPAGALRVPLGRRRGLSKAIFANSRRVNANNGIMALGCGKALALGDMCAG